MKKNKKHEQKKINSLFEAAMEIQIKINEFNWKFCFIGGLAVIRWGEIRMTQDIDLCLLCGFGNEEIYINKLLGLYKSRIKNAPEFALKNRVLLLITNKNVPIDISLSGIPFEDEMVNRSTSFIFYPDCPLVTCSAEDLIILKAFADRTKDWVDIESILIRQGRKLDQKYVKSKLTPLCELKESLEIVDKLNKLFNDYIK
jgi:hypothetical protein